MDGVDDSPLSAGRNETLLTLHLGPLSLFTREEIMKKLVLTALFATLWASSAIVAQEIPQFPQPQKEHEWLQKFVGEWSSESKASMGPGVPEMQCQGKMKSRMLGGFWLISDNEGDMGGMKMAAVQTIGYDVEKKKYVGTWIDSMMNHMWKYEGTVDASGKKLTLEAEGPNMAKPGTTAKYRDIYEFKSNDELAISSEMQGEDGKWVVFMTGKAKRTK